MEQRHQADKRDMEMKLELDKVKADADRKLDIEKAKAEMDRKLMESKIQQQAVDMQQNLVMSMTKATPASPVHSVQAAPIQAVPVQATPAQTVPTQAAPVFLDPSLEDAKKRFLKLDESAWQTLTSSALRAEVAPMRKILDTSNNAYHALFLQAKVMRPALDKVANRTSVSGKPKSPIKAKNHIDYPFNEPAHGKVYKPQGYYLDKRSPCFIFDDQDRLQTLGTYPHFKQEPTIKSFLTSVYDFTKRGDALNKQGKAQAATQIISLADQTIQRLSSQEVCA